MMTPDEFLRKVSLYETQIGSWTQVGSDLVAHVQLAGYNQPTYDKAKDPQIKPVILVFKSAVPMDDATRTFFVPASTDVQIIEDEPILENQQHVGLGLVCELQTLPRTQIPPAAEYVKLRFRFEGVEILKAPPLPSSLS